MDSPIFYILATIVTIIVLYIMVSLAYMKKRKNSFLAMQDQLRVGDTVMVANSIYGTVKELKKDIVKVEIAERITITADRATVFRREVNTGE